MAEILPLPKLTIDDEIRFWSKVIRKSPKECWNWVGGCTGNWESRRRPVFKKGNHCYIAARIAYFITHKRDPGARLLVCHTCSPGFGKRQLCVNPNHLWLGTYTENLQDAADKGEAPTGNRSKLLDHDKEIIKERYERGDSPSQIGLDYNLHRRSIWRIATGQA